MSLQERFSRLDALLELTPGWLEGSGDAINHADADIARELLETLNTRYPDHLPGIFPMEAGGISLEWVNSTALLNVEVENGSISTFYLDSRLNSSAFEDIATVDSVIPLIEEWIMTIG